MLYKYACSCRAVYNIGFKDIDKDGTDYIDCIYCGKPVKRHSGKINKFFVNCDKVDRELVNKYNNTLMLML
jgi:hypothetical protein